MQPFSSHSGQKAERIVAYDSKTVRKLRLTANVLLQRWRQWMTSRLSGAVDSAVALRAAACQVFIQIHRVHSDLHRLSLN